MREEGSRNCSPIEAMELPWCRVCPLLSVNNDKTNQRDPTRDLQLGPQPRLRAFVLLALTIAGLYLCFWPLLPFLPAIVWALALAILFVAAHRRVATELKNANLAATISVFLIGLVVVVPVILISGRVSRSGIDTPSGALAEHGTALRIA